jgi:signal recognition particle receptor subunit alpha
MESSLQKILTPTSSLDLLREIDAVSSPSALSLQKKRPYVMSIVGVNGVGKSTNLSKICFFLLQNKYRVLVVACDTFRSGAVEQLAVHVRNLKELTAREGGEVELYQKGYGKDAANVAKDAVTFATQEGFDVVLIDTAGRRHNDQVRSARTVLGNRLLIFDSVLCLLSRNLQNSQILTRFSWLER